MVKSSSLAQLRNKSPRQFEEYIALLLPELGYTNVSLTNLTADSGYDIEAYKNNEKVLFECKKYSEHNKVGSRDIRIFADVYYSEIEKLSSFSCDLSSINTF